MQVLRNRSFLALLGTQFLGAFNDNVYRGLLLLLALESEIEFFGIQAESFALALFAFPFVLFALLGGSLADRFSKRNVIVTTNIFEIVAMTLGTLALTLSSTDASSIDRTSMIASLAVLFIMGTQSALFGPSKYGILPEIVKPGLLSSANGLISMTTQLAIILGLVSASGINLLLKELELPVYAPGFVCIGVATVGWLFSLMLPKLKAADPSKKLALNILSVPIHAYREFRYNAKDSELIGSLLSSSWFFLIGSLALLVFNVHAEAIWGMERIQGGTLLAAVATGIALGSLTAGQLSKGRPELGLAPIGAFGMGLAFCTVPFASGSEVLFKLPFAEIDVTGQMVATHAIVLVAGFFGGLYIVPLNTFVQARPKPEEKGRVLGFHELLSFVFVISAAGVYELLALDAFKLNSTQLLVATGVLTIVGSALFSVSSPVFVQRAILFLIAKFYRIKVYGNENVPARGPALLVANHVSYADPFFVSAASPRIPRFLMHRFFMGVPGIAHFARLTNVIPISAGDGPRALLKSLERAAEHLKRGHSVCIFAEGKITRTGTLLPFSKGLERIAREADSPIIPVYLDGVWGSVFSYHRGKILWRWPRRLPHLSVSFGEPLPPDTPTWKVRQRLLETGAEALERRKHHGVTLATRFVRMAKRRGSRLALADTTGKELSFRKTLVACLLLRQQLRERTEDQEYVGILLPASVGGALANISVTLLGKVSVNLNFTTGPEAYQSAIEQTELKTIITSKRFIDKIGMESDERFVFIEDLAAAASGADKVKNLLATYLPSWLLIRIFGLPRDPDQVAAVMFSSGSTGQPKGVELTHHNFLSEIACTEPVFDATPEDRMMGILPFFHCFGYAITIWFPVTLGFSSIYHPSPLDARGIAEALRKFQATIFIATPTFYQSYLRRFSPEDVASLRLSVAGAEKLKSSLRKSWKEKFGTEIFEGYGCTELSPAICMNTHNHTGEIQQTGHKPGTIGHPFPGVAVRVVDPDTYEVLSPNREGLLLVKGPIVMKGYLHRPEETAEVIRDGWYVTGDMAKIDADGFIELTGRYSRFSKIGGEMVPHVRVEEAIQEIIDERMGCPAESVDQDCPEAAVTSVASDARGEQLVVLHTPLTFSIEELHRELIEGPLPNLWCPKRNAFHEVSELPKLGSGKLDLKELGKVAEEAHLSVESGAGD